MRAIQGDQRNDKDIVLGGEIQKVPDKPGRPFDSNLLWRDEL